MHQKLMNGMIFFLVLVVVFSSMIAYLDPGNENLKGKAYSAERGTETLDLQSNLAENQKAYVYGPGGRLAKFEATKATYYHSDHLGSTSFATDETGQVVFEGRYEPFGGDYVSQGEERYKYTGQEQDNTGLYYYGARYYNPTIGRFMAIDPVVGNIYNPQRLNPYSYVLNNPFKFVDPSGTSEWEPYKDVYAAGYFPLLTDPPSGYQCPMELLCTGHPIRAARQWGSNLANVEPYRLGLDVVDAVATGKEYLNGEVGGVALAAAVIPGIPGNFVAKYGRKITTTGRIFQQSQKLYRVLGAPVQGFSNTVDFSLGEHAINRLNRLAGTREAQEVVLLKILQDGKIYDAGNGDIALGIEDLGSVILTKTDDQMSGQFGPRVRTILGKGGNNPTDEWVDSRWTEIQEVPQDFREAFGNAN